VILLNSIDTDGPVEISTLIDKMKELEDKISLLEGREKVEDYRPFISIVSEVLNIPIKPTIDGTYPSSRQDDIIQGIEPDAYGVYDIETPREAPLSDNTSIHYHDDLSDIL